MANMKTHLSHMIQILKNPHPNQSLWLLDKPEARISWWCWVEDRIAGERQCCEWQWNQCRWWHSVGLESKRRNRLQEEMGTVKMFHLWCCMQGFWLGRLSVAGDNGITYQWGLGFHPAEVPLLWSGIFILFEMVHSMQCSVSQYWSTLSKGTRRKFNCDVEVV